MLGNATKQGLHLIELTCGLEAGVHGNPDFTLTPPGAILQAKCLRHHTASD